MKNLGLVFKTMRKSRKLSLAEATGGLFPFQCYLDLRMAKRKCLPKN